MTHPDTTELTTLSHFPHPHVQCPGAGLYAIGNCVDKYWSCAAKGADPVEMPCAPGTVGPAPELGLRCWAWSRCLAVLFSRARSLPLRTPNPGAPSSVLPTFFKEKKCTFMPHLTPLRPTPLLQYFDETLGVCQLKTQAFGCTCTTVTALVRNNSDFSTLLAALEVGRWVVGGARGHAATCDTFAARAALVADLQQAAVSVLVERAHGTQNIPCGVLQPGGDRADCRPPAST